MRNENVYGHKRCLESLRGACVRGDYFSSILLLQYNPIRGKTIHIHTERSILRYLEFKF